MCEERITKDDRMSEIFSQNQGLIHMVVNRFLSRGKEREELYQIGALGMWKAIRGYDESRGYAFSTYAVPFIMGEIKMALRSDQAIHVSRSIQENAAHIEKVRKEKEDEWKREVTLEELVQFTGLSREAVVQALEVRREVASLDEPLGEGTGSGEDILCSKSNEEEQVINKLTVEAMLNRLGDMEREVIRMRYFENMTQVETAKALGMNQVAVSRMEKKTLLKLRMEIL